MWCLALLEIMVANPTNMNCFMQVCVNLSTTLTWPPEAKLFCLHMQSYLIQRHHKKFSCSFRGKNPDLSDLMTFYIIAIGHSSFTSCSVCWCSPMPHQLLCEVSAMCPQPSHEAAGNHVATYSDTWWRSLVGLLYPCASTQLPLASWCPHHPDHDVGLILFLNLFPVFLAPLVSFSATN